MKYTLTIESDRVELWGFGIKLTDDEARRVIRHAAKHYSAEQPSHDPDVPHDDLSTPARPA